MARLEKKHKEDYDNNVVVDTDQELESSPENEIATPDLEEAKKRKKKGRKSSGEKGRGDGDVDEKQKFHPKQVCLVIHVCE